jgi:putative transcriptional regulator
MPAASCAAPLLRVLLVAAAALGLAAAEPSEPTEPALPAELGKGVFLVAKARLADPNFESTVVLLLDYGPGGALGLVVNKPSSVDLSKVLPELEQLRGRPLSLYYGGPVSPKHIRLLFDSPAPPPGSDHVLGEVHVSARRGVLEQILENTDSLERVRAYSGYSGWAPRQLDAEVERNDWYVVKADPAIVFETEPDALWQRLIETLSRPWVRGPDQGIS